MGKLLSLSEEHFKACLLTSRDIGIKQETNTAWNRGGFRQNLLSSIPYDLDNWRLGNGLKSSEDINDKLLSGPSNRIG